MNCFNITPDLVRDLSYHSKCKLAAPLKVVDPTTVKIVGSLVLDDLGHVVSCDAFVEIAQ